MAKKRYVLVMKSGKQIPVTGMTGRYYVTREAQYRKNNPEFRSLHEYYTTRANNPLKKKQSVIAISCKLIRVFYAILSNGVTYDPQKMLSDIHRPSQAA